MIASQLALLTCPHTACPPWSTVSTNHGIDQAAQIKQRVASAAARPVFPAVYWRSLAFGFAELRVCPIVLARPLCSTAAAAAIHARCARHWHELRPHLFKSAVGARSRFELRSGLWPALGRIKGMLDRYRAVGQLE
jgi:hypothetical protein